MPDWLLPVLGLAALVIVQFALRRWVIRRWLANGMRPTTAALLSMAAIYVPALALFVLASILSGRLGWLDEWPVLLVVIALPLLLGFGMRAAVFEYAEKHGVRAELKRTMRLREVHTSEERSGEPHEG
jgi:hypothetical protein